MTHAQETCSLRETCIILCVLFWCKFMQVLAQTCAVAAFYSAQEACARKKTCVMRKKSCQRGKPLVSLQVSCTTLLSGCYGYNISTGRLDKVSSFFNGIQHSAHDVAIVPYYVKNVSGWTRTHEGCSKCSYLDGDCLTSS